LHEVETWEKRYRDPVFREHWEPASMELLDFSVIIETGLVDLSS